jgi:hypothetical protein
MLNNFKMSQFNSFQVLSKIFILLAFCLISLSSCNKNKHNPEPSPEEIKEEKRIKDSIDCQAKLKESENFPLVNYRKEVLETSKDLANFKALYSDSAKYDSMRVIATINRKEIRFFRLGDTVIVPDTFSTDHRLYSVFPRYYCEAKDIPKLIIVSNPMQAYACYENGTLVRFAACNTGKETTPTYPGRYSLVWRAYLRKSSLDSTWILPFTFNFHQYAGCAFHQFEMPGRAVSHSCVRQFREDAKWLFKWGKQAKLDSNRRFIPWSGSPVIMLGMFDYDRKKGGPWFDISSNKEGIIKLEGDPMQVEEAWIPFKQIPKESRGSLRNRKRYMVAEDTLRARGIIREHIELKETVNFNKLRRDKAKKAKKDAELKAKEAQKNHNQE